MSRKEDILTRKYPFLRKNVIVYDDKKDLPLLINPYRNSNKKVSRLTRHEALLLGQLKGNTKTRDICRRLPMDEKLILGMLKRWSQKSWNMIKLLDVPLDKIKTEKKNQEKYTNIYAQLFREAHSAREARRERAVIKTYHKRRIQNAIEQFDNRETTVSHIYKEAHIILAGKNYGASFADALMKKGAIHKGTEILEIGGGTGIFAQSFLDEILNIDPQIYKNISYTIFEISSMLLKSQKVMLKKHNNVIRFIHGDIESYDFKHKKFDLIISNEMIADLSTVRLKKIDLRYKGSFPKDKKRAVSLIKEFKLDTGDAPKVFLFNLGAIELLYSIKRLLKAKGKAYVVEYGSKWLYPRAVKLTGHTEYSIHFGFLTKVAAKLNMDPSLELLIDFLPFNKRVNVVNKVSFSLINDYLLPFLKLERMPDDRVYTEDMMREKIGKVFDQLSFVGFTHLGSGEARLDPSDFLVLELSVD